MPATLKEIKHHLNTAIDSTPERVSIFFKKGVGEYAEHDQFMGITVPTLRKIAKQYRDIKPTVIKGLLESCFNEERLLALLILVQQYQTGDITDRDRIYQFYLSHLSCVNNWNLVDSSAHLIVGHHLWDKDPSLLNRMARSNDLWERRIAIVATWYFIRQGETSKTFELSEYLMNDSHDLIHKATGWMLREAGKKNEAELVSFLRKQAQLMPKTMLRYAMERLTPEQKQSINR